MYRIPYTLYRIRDGKISALIKIQNYFVPLRWWLNSDDKVEENNYGMGCDVRQQKLVAADEIWNAHKQMQIALKLSTPFTVYRSRSKNVSCVNRFSTFFSFYFLFLFLFFIFMNY